MEEMKRPKTFMLKKSKEKAFAFLSAPAVYLLNTRYTFCNKAVA
jgi:hypothetical protein